MATTVDPNLKEAQPENPENGGKKSFGLSLLTRRGRIVPGVDLDSRESLDAAMDGDDDDDSP